ncbi:MAG TPA: cache domain-containing protein [Candidatus Saccharimonadales bacterium]|nr:cache domain-containing protein [Candidatus Saccharimonadales bacterium]
MIREYQSRLTLFSVLLLGSFTILFVSTSVTETFSQTNESLSQNDAPNETNVTASQQSNTSNTELLENLGLSTTYQSLEQEIRQIMNLAYQSMNLTNSFGTFPLSNITADMQQQYRGIPNDQDEERRNEAKSLLANNQYLSFIGMTLPNGDTYFSEPFFSSQANSSKHNYGYRDHIVGALESKSPYLSNVISAASTGQPLVVLASPIFSGKEANNTLIGVLALGLNLNQFNELLKSELVGKNDTRLLLLDNNGTKVSDSQSNMVELKSFKYLQSFQNARDGKTGSIVESVDGKNMTISYAPVNFAQSKWILLSMSAKG